MNHSRRLLLQIGWSLALLLIGSAFGWWIASHEPERFAGHVESHPTTHVENKSPETQRKVLYWYDPMQPQQHFDKPGPSPFMDMDLIPKYADTDANPSESIPSLTIDAAVSQNIAIRLTEVGRVPLSRQIDATGIIGFNEHDVAIVQTRSSGFVEQVWSLAEGDIVKAGQPLTRLLVPAWNTAQHEWLVLRESGDDGLLHAARERLRLLGMPEAMIRHLQKSGRVQNDYTISSPISGVIQKLEVRNGMTLNQGQDIARIVGLDTVWLEAAVPEAQATLLRVGDQAQIRLSAFPDRAFDGRVFDILPMLDAGSRSARVRVALKNPELKLRPGQSAQVSLNTSTDQTVLAVPTEAVIHTGKRNLVMLALDQGRYSPQEVNLGPEIGNQTVIAAGLKEGQHVVVSGQFLLDSEASLNGIPPQPAEPKSMTDMPMHDHTGHNPAWPDEGEAHHHTEGAP